MPAQTTTDPILNRIAAAKTVVLGQSGRLAADLGRVSSNWKTDGSRVTETDFAISTSILGELLEAFPEDQGFSEEQADDKPVAVTSRFSWMLDPIDGTNNFAIGLPQCAIALALLEKGEPIYGVIYDVSRQRLLHGGPGYGVWDGETPARVTEVGLSRKAVVGFHSPHEEGKYPGHGEAMVEACKVRAFGSSALHLAYVAVGLLDGVVDHNVKLWDIAAGIPMIRAAGGEVRFLANNALPLRSFDLEMPRIFYVGGCPQMCADLAGKLTAVKDN